MNLKEADMRFIKYISCLFITTTLFNVMVQGQLAPGYYTCQKEDLELLGLTDGALISIKTANESQTVRFQHIFNQNIATMGIKGCKLSLINNEKTFSNVSFACELGYSIFGSIFRVEQAGTNQIYLGAMSRGGGQSGVGVIEYHYISRTSVATKQFNEMYVVMKEKPLTKKYKFEVAFMFPAVGTGTNSLSYAPGYFHVAAQSPTGVSVNNNIEYFQIEVLNKPNPPEERGNELRYENTAFTITIGGTSFQAWAENHDGHPLFGSEIRSGDYGDEKNPEGKYWYCPCDVRSWGKATIAYFLRYPTGSNGVMHYGDAIRILQPWSTDWTKNWGKRYSRPSIENSWPQESEFVLSNGYWTQTSFDAYWLKGSGVDRIGTLPEEQSARQIFYIASPHHGYKIGDAVRENDIICLTTKMLANADGSAFADLSYNPIWFWDWFEFTTPLWGGDRRKSSADQQIQLSYLGPLQGRDRQKSSTEPDYLVLFRDARFGQDFIRSTYNLIKINPTTKYYSAYNYVSPIPHPSNVTAEWNVSEKLVKFVTAKTFDDFKQAIDAAFTITALTALQKKNYRAVVLDAFVKIVTLVSAPSECTRVITLIQQALNHPNMIDVDMQQNQLKATVAIPVRDLLTQLLSRLQNTYNLMMAVGRITTAADIQNLLQQLSSSQFSSIDLTKLRDDAGTAINKKVYDALSKLLDAAKTQATLDSAITLVTTVSKNQSFSNLKKQFDDLINRTRTQAKAQLGARKSTLLAKFINAVGAPATKPNTATGFCKQIDTFRRTRGTTPPRIQDAISCLNTAKAILASITPSLTNDDFNVHILGDTAFAQKMITARKHFATEFTNLVTGSFGLVASNMMQLTAVKNAYKAAWAAIKKMPGFTTMFPPAILNNLEKQYLLK
jgi:hypothetical protein